MCTILLRLDPGSDEPVLLAANRDEFRARAADDPLVIAPGVFAGRDRQAGGTWLAVRAGGLAALTNIGGMPRRPDAPSRGDLPLAALANRLPRDFAAYNAFNLLVIDSDGARVFSHAADGRPVAPIQLGAGDHAIVNEPFGAVSCPRGRAARGLLAGGAPGFDLLATHGDTPERAVPSRRRVRHRVVDCDRAGSRPARGALSPSCGATPSSATRDLTATAQAATLV